MAALALTACGGGGSTDGAEQSGNTAVESTNPTDGSPTADATPDANADTGETADTNADAEQTADANADAGQTADAADAGQTADVNAEQSGEVIADAGTLAADPVVSGDTQAPEPEAGESGFGSMEAQSKNFEQLELAQGGTYEEDTATEGPATDAAAETSESADSGDRESAQSLTNIAGRTGYAKPKVAALDYSSSMSYEKRKLLAKFKFVILGGRGGSDLNSFTTGIRSMNPSTKFAYYVAFNELACSIESGNYYYSAVQMANKTDYWLRYASGSRTQWTSQYNTCDMNISGWAKKNSAGQTWMQYKARYDVDRIFNKAPKIEYAFSDNTFSVPRVNADWKRIRTNQLKTDPTIITAQRQGQAKYWSALRSIKSSIKILGNANNDLSYYEYKGKLNGAMQEAAMGKSWSLETWAGWDKMMERYRRQIANTAAPKDVFLEVRGLPERLQAHALRTRVGSARERMVPAPAVERHVPAEVVRRVRGADRHSGSEPAYRAQVERHLDAQVPERPGAREPEQVVYALHLYRFRLQAPERHSGSHCEQWSLPEHRDARPAPGPDHDQAVVPGGCHPRRAAGLRTCRFFLRWSALLVTNDMLDLRVNASTCPVNLRSTDVASA